MVAQAPSPVLSVDVALTDAVVAPEGFATCPTCHMVNTALTNASVDTGGNWRCARCGQSWDKHRVAAVAAYAAWDSARKRNAEADVPAP
jgi:transcription elongation factor Elf1